MNLVESEEMTPESQEWKNKNHEQQVQLKKKKKR